MRATKNAATAAAIGTWAILLTAFVVTILYVGRQLRIPLALAAMPTFLLAPLVGYIERWIGRIAAVLIWAAWIMREPLLPNSGRGSVRPVSIAGKRPGD
jgi:predicted PurR-regulated permease PerM